MGMIIQNGKQYFPVYNDSEIKALPTVSTASGSIATFDTDMTENLVEVKCQIVATQSGSGTPSPDNQRPITTYTEMNVSATGKNLANVPDTSNISSQTTFETIFLQAGVYTMSANVKNNGSVICYLSLRRNGVTKGIITINANEETTKNATIKLTEDSDYAIVASGSSAGCNFNISEFQLEQGDTPTTYEPYNGTTANIPFGQTVANGVLDVTTGKLRVTDKVVDMGSLNWGSFTFGSNSGFRAILSDGEAVGGGSGIGNAVCSVFPIVANSAVGASGADMVMAVGAYWTTGCNAYVVDSDYTTESDFKTGMSGNQLVYKLATPEVIQLSSTQISALLNENNIWCDTGDTEVKYLLTVGKKIA